MSPSNYINNNFQNKSEVFPYCIPPDTYGTTLFWAEEYWASVEMKKLLKKYPEWNFSGVTDPIFIKIIFELLDNALHQKIISTTNFNEISDIAWEINRNFLNIATSHAPSRFIALQFLELYQKDFAIINIDAHLDLSESSFIHGAWLNNELAAITAMVGGWSENVSDLTRARKSLAFLAPDVNSLLHNNAFSSWIQNKKLYITIDLDYFQMSQDNYLGYSNYWHRNKIIGHSITVDQILQKEGIRKTTTSPYVLALLVESFSNLDKFTKYKKASLEQQSLKISTLLKNIADFCASDSVTLLGIDFVEYSPICDWKQLTITEFIKRYPKFIADLHPLCE